MNENTPLSSTAGSTARNGLDSISQFARKVFTKENLEKAGSVAQEKANELKSQAQDGDHSLRLLAFLGGVLLLVVAGLELAGNILKFNLIGALIEFYSLLIGIMIILLEGKNIVLSTVFVDRIFKYALFLKFLWGRGAIYFIFGTLQLYQVDLFNLIAGGYLCCIGVLFILVGQRTAYKLKALRNNLYSERDLHQKFAQADIDGDGGLNLQQFRNLAWSLGLEMTRKETEAAFNYMKKTEQEKLSYEEFKAWWTDTDADHDLHPNSFAFV